VTTTEELNLIVRLRDEASGALGKLRSGLGSVGAVAGGAVVAGAAAATAAIAGVGAAAITAQGRVATLEKAFGGALDEATADALFLADAYDQDLTEAARSAQRVQDEFGASAEEAFLVLTEGQELGLDRFGDLNDTLNEYSDDFADLGVTGFDSLALINEGLEAGFRNTDKVGDAFNEFSIRLRDPAVVKNIRDIDESTADLFDQFARGEITQRQAFERIADSIESIEDPLQRQEAGVQAFGTTFEDFGADATFALGEALEGVEALGTEIEESGRQYDTFGALWAGITSETTAALAPLGDKLLEIANQAMPHIISAIEWFGTNAPGWIDMAVETFDKISPIITSVANAIKMLFTGDYEGLGTIFDFDEDHPAITFILDFRRLITENIGAGIETFKTLWSQASETVTNIVNALQPIITGVFSIIQQFLEENGESIRLFFEETWNQITNIISLAIQLINDTIVPVLQGIATFISEHRDEIVDILTMAWNQITNVIGLALTAIQSALTLALQLIDGDWRGAWNTIEEFSEEFITTFQQLFENGFNMLLKIVGLVMDAFGVDIDEAFQAAEDGFAIFRANFIDPIINAFQAIGQAIQNAISNILNLGERLRNIKPPDWLSQWGTDIQEGAQVITGQRGFARGGRPPVGQVVTVGEEGPEDVIFGAPATVVPADLTAAMNNGGGGGLAIGPFNFNISGGNRGAMVTQAVNEFANQLNAALDQAEMRAA
jgi:hypothetical protein